MTDRMLTAALGYAKRLNWPVLPLRGKVPAIAGGRGCLDATTDPALIDAWWRDCPSANVGIATGERAGFWVLDVDPRHGGDTSLAALEQEHAPLPVTVEQATGGGGQHLLYRYDPARPVRNRVGIRPGLDTRGDGGYVVVPPSAHPDTGRPYAWRPDRHPLRIPIADAPDLLLALAAPPEVPAGTLSGGAVIESDRWGPVPRYSRGALERACQAIACAPIGQQDATLIREAFSVGTLVAGGHMPASLAADALVWAGLQMSNHPRRRPWRQPEIREKVARAFSRAAAYPRGPKAHAA